MEGCRNQDPSIILTWETMATVPKVTEGAGKGEESALGGRKLREDGTQRENPRERETQLKMEHRPGMR